VKDGGGKLRREREGEVLVVDYRRAARRSCVAEAVERARSSRKIHPDSGFGRLHRRRRLRRKAL